MTSNTARAGLGFDGVVSGGIRFKGDRMNATPSSGVLYTQDEKDTLLQMTNETLNARDRLSQHKEDRKQALAYKKALILKKQKKNLQTQQIGLSTSPSPTTTQTPTAVPLSSTLSSSNSSTIALASSTNSQTTNTRPRKSRWKDTNESSVTDSISVPQRQMALSFLSSIQSPAS